MNETARMSDLISYHFLFVMVIDQMSDVRIHPKRWSCRHVPKREHFDKINQTKTLSVTKSPHVSRAFERFFPIQFNIFINRDIFYNIPWKSQSTKHKPQRSYPIFQIFSMISTAWSTVISSSSRPLSPLRDQRQFLVLLEPRLPDLADSLFVRCLFGQAPSKPISCNMHVYLA